MPSLRWTLRGEESDETDIPTLGELPIRETDPLTSTGHMPGSPGRAGRSEGLPFHSSESPVTSAMLSSEHHFHAFWGPFV